jgi:hypothetical protein
VVDSVEGFTEVIEDADSIVTTIKGVVEFGEKGEDCSGGGSVRAEAMLAVRQDIVFVEERGEAIVHYVLKEFREGREERYGSVVSVVIFISLFVDR